MGYTHTHNCLMVLCLGLTGSASTRKKHSPTHTHEEEEQVFAKTTRSSLTWELIPFTVL